MNIAKQRRKKQITSTLTPYLFILPNTLIFTIFIVIPALFGFYYSLTEWDGLTEMKMVGLANFEGIIKSEYFWDSLSRTVFYVLLTVPLLFVVSLFLANLLIKDLRFKGIFRAVFYWPTMISFIIVGVTWKWMLGDSFGIVNYLLSNMGLEPVRWLTDGFYANVAVIAASIWSRAGFYMIMFIAGLQSIPISYYEASDIDGASAFQRFRWITFPLLKPTNFLVLILSMIDAFKAYPLVFSLTDGGPNKATTYLVQSIYEQGFNKNQFGYASAMSVCLFLILSILTFVQFKVNKGGEVQ